MECITHWLTHVVFAHLLYCFPLHTGLVSGWGSSVCAPTHLLLSGSGWSVISSLCFPASPPFCPLRLSQLSVHSPIAQDVKSAHNSQLKRTPFLQTVPSASAWSAFSCAFGFELWAIVGPLRSIILEQGAWTAQLCVQYVQTICLMTQPSAWSNCILQHSVVPFSETEKDQESILPRTPGFVMDGWSVATFVSAL